MNFRIDFSNFADDCSLCMVPMDYKCELNNYIKYNYRLVMQHSIEKFYDWTRYNKLIIAKSDSQFRS